MNLNAYIIRDYMDEPVLWECIREDLIGLPYENVDIYEHGLPAQGNTVYVISPADFMRNYEELFDGAYIITGPCEQSIPKEPVSVLCIAGTKSPLEIRREIQRVFHFFYKWEVSLYQLLSRNAPLREYGVCSLEIFDNPITMYNPGHRNVFFCEKQKPKHLMLFHEEDIDAYLPDVEIEELRLDPVFQASIYATRPTIYPADMWGYRILYDNVRVEDVYVARIMICEYDHPIRDSDYPLLRVLACFLSHGLRHQDILFDNHPKGFDDCISQLVQGQQPEEALLQSALTAYKWHITDLYFCVLIPVNTYDQRMRSVSSVCSRLESSIAESAAIINKGQILLIVNQKRALSTRDEILAQLIYIQRENLLKAGVSNTFSNLMELSEYYQQALVALSIGSESNEMLWTFRYEKYAYRHLLIRASEGFSVEALCPAGLLRLIRYDREHKRTYTRSLKAFIENHMSVSRAIRQLYLQRATFIYQLKRIKEISGLNLNDKSSQFQLLIVFQIMDERKYELPAIM